MTDTVEQCVPDSFDIIQMVVINYYRLAGNIGSLADV